MCTRIARLLGMVLLVTACSGGSDSATIISTTSSISSTTTTAGPTTTVAPTTSTVATPSTTSRPIDVFYDGGQVVGPGRFSYSVGDQVSVWVLSDTEAEIHVHSYDVFFQTRPGVPIEITLTVDVPGIFEVELESTHTLLFELEVTP